MKHLLNIFIVVPIALAISLCVNSDVLIFGEEGLIMSLTEMWFFPSEKESEPLAIADKIFLWSVSIPLLPIIIRLSMEETEEEIKRNHLRERKAKNVTTEKKTESKETPAVDIRKALKERYDGLQEKIADYRMKMGLAIRYPVMNDPRDEFTANMLKALKTAENSVNSHATVYQKAVDDLELAFQQAEYNARTIALKRVSDADRKDFVLAQNLLKHITDYATTQKLRVNYANKLKQVIQQINERNNIEIIPNDSTQELEQHTRLQILK